MENREHFDNRCPLWETCDKCQAYIEYLIEWIRDGGKRLKMEYHHYFVTLTTDEKDPVQLEKDRIKIIDRLQPTEYYCYYELTKAGRPHVHMLLTMDKYVRARDIKRCTKKFVDIKRIKSPQYLKNVKNYIKKDANTPEIREYMEKYNLSNIYTLCHQEDTPLSLEEDVEHGDTEEELGDVPNVSMVVRPASTATPANK